MTDRIACLAGGVGAARFLEGLVRVRKPEDITVIVNTGDDLEMYGLHISPDLDIITYTLAGIVDERQGWGLRGDTYHAMASLARYGIDTWFMVGDRDLATHLLRTELLGQSHKLSDVTRRIRTDLNIRTEILPMSDEKVRTKVHTDAGILSFQEYFVKRGQKDRVLSVTYETIESAKPTAGVVEALREAEKIIICPSNPILSIGPVLSLKSIKETLAARRERVVAVSPIVEGKALKGPADRNLVELGLEASAFGVAKLYSDFAGSFVLDERDKILTDRIQRLGLQVVTADTVMRNIDAKANLANITLTS